MAGCNGILSAPTSASLHPALLAIAAIAPPKPSVWLGNIKIHPLNDRKQVLSFLYSAPQKRYPYCLYSYFFCYDVFLVLQNSGVFRISGVYFGLDSILLPYQKKVSHAYSHALSKNINRVKCQYPSTMPVAVHFSLKILLCEI